MFLHTKLENKKHPIKICFIGCGKFVSMFLAQYNHLDKIQIDTIVDININQAKKNCLKSGLNENTVKEIFETLNGKIDFEFILSEDGSTDGTKDILKKLKQIYPIDLISEEGRKYYSKAVIDGIKKAKADYLLIMDSDGQSDPKDIFNFWQNKENSDLVNGYRHPRYDFAYRRFISKTFYILYKF